MQSLSPLNIRWLEKRNQRLIIFKIFMGIITCMDLFVFYIPVRIKQKMPFYWNADSAQYHKVIFGDENFSQVGRIRHRKYLTVAAERMQSKRKQSECFRIASQCRMNQQMTWLLEVKKGVSDLLISAELLVTQQTT